MIAYEKQGRGLFTSALGKALHREWRSTRLNAVP